MQNDQGKLILGSRNYELTNHLGNVLAVISDKKILLDSVFQADVVSANDYYPFGMTIESRSFVSETYRFGFNGKENDTDFGEGIQDYGFRLYDRRISRFLSTDPLFKSYPWYTPYQFAGNTPIQAIDLDGLEPSYMIDKTGKLTKPVIILLNATFDFDIGRLETSTWRNFQRNYQDNGFIRLMEKPIN